MTSILRTVQSIRLTYAIARTWRAQAFQWGMLVIEYKGAPYFTNDDSKEKRW